MTVSERFKHVGARAPRCSVPDPSGPDAARVPRTRLASEPAKRGLGRTLAQRLILPILLSPPGVFRLTLPCATSTFQGGEGLSTPTPQLRTPTTKDLRLRLPQEWCPCRSRW